MYQNKYITHKPRPQSRYDNATTEQTNTSLHNYSRQDLSNEQGDDDVLYQIAHFKSIDQMVQQQQKQN